MRTRLNELRPGRRAVILRTEYGGALGRRLLALGFVRGTEVFCERLSPFGGPVLVSLRGFRVALRRTEGERIFVETGEDDEDHSTGRES